MLCPTCRRQYPAGTAFCSEDATRLLPFNANENPTGAPQGALCPVCRRGFDPGVKVCPTHGEELIPYALKGTIAQPQAPVAKGKICPTCGGRFDGSATFCGKDGTALVLLN
jgi:hypothetical protein